MSNWWSNNRKGLAVAAGVLLALIVLPWLADLLGSDVMGTFWGFVILGLLAVGYFVPTVVATLRKHRQAGAIIAVNVLLGWTFIGWVVALVWAMTNPAPPVVVQAPPPPVYQVGDVVNGHRFNGQTWEPTA